MSIAGSCIGIEIDHEAIRAAILESKAQRIIGYVEVRRSKRKQDDFHALAKELGSLWSKLPEKFTGNVRVAATIGHSLTGSFGGPNAAAKMESLKLRSDEPLSVVNDNETFYYAPRSLIARYRQAFETNEITLERLELAPRAAIRSLEPNLTCDFTVGSGMWWSAQLDHGQLVVANQTEVNSDDRSLYLTKPGAVEERQLVELNETQVSKDLLTTFGIVPANLAVVVGAAKGLIDATPCFKVGNAHNPEVVNVNVGTAPTLATNSNSVETLERTEVSSDLAVELDPTLETETIDEPLVDNEIKLEEGLTLILDDDDADTEASGSEPTTDVAEVEVVPKPKRRFRRTRAVGRFVRFLAIASFAFLAGIGIYTLAENTGVLDEPPVSDWLETLNLN